MIYGKYTDLVNEVIEFAKVGQIFVPTATETAGITVVRNFEQALKMAKQQTYGDAEYLWTDIREMEMSRVKAVGYTIAEFAQSKEKLAENIKLFTMFIRRRLDEQHRDLLDDVVADLYNCAVARAIQGNSPGFFETLLDVYKTGGWPCGWDGNYPQGRIAGCFQSTGGNQ